MGLSAGRSVQAAGLRILVFQTVCGSLQRRVQMVYDLTEKIASSLDLIEKNIAENDLVYVLTEIDRSRLARAHPDSHDHDQAPDLYGVAKRGVGARAAPRCGSGSLSAACRAGQEQQGPKRPVSEQFQGRTWAIYSWTSRAPCRVLIRIEPAAAVLHSSRPTDHPPIRRSRWDRKTGLSASVSASDHHFSDPQRNHQPKTATAQRSRGGEKSGDLSGFGSGRCFC